MPSPSTARSCLKVARTDDVVKAVRDAAERFRTLLDAEDGLTGIVFSVRFASDGSVASVIGRPEAKWRPNFRGVCST